MIRYFDASALVKRYVREIETAAVVRLLRESTVVTSRLSEAEIGSALARRLREGGLTSSAHDAALSMMLKDMGRFQVIELAPSVVAGVHRLLARHPLRSGDALQLAAALTLRDAASPELELVCFDERLRAAARAEGLRPLPATLNK